MMWARIENGAVAEILETDPTGLYHPSIVFVAISEEQASYISVGSVLTEEGELQPSSIEELEQDLLARLANIRWQEQEKGLVSFKDHTFPTNEAARANMGNTFTFGSIQEANDGAGSFVANWKSADGFVSLSLNELTQLGALVGVFIQAQFDKEDEVSALVRTAETSAEKLEAYELGLVAMWPGSYAEAELEPIEAKDPADDSPVNDENQ